MDQCNQCGGFENLGNCEHCSVRVCRSCRTTHGPVCAQNKVFEAQGKGGTVSNGGLNARSVGLNIPTTPAPEPREGMRLRFREVVQPGDVVVPPVVIAPADIVDEANGIIREQPVVSESVPVQEPKKTKSLLNPKR